KSTIQVANNVPRRAPAPGMNMVRSYADALQSKPAKIEKKELSVQCSLLVPDEDKPAVQPTSQPTPQPQPQPTSMDPAELRHKIIDTLLEDIDRYPIPGSGNAQAVLSMMFVLTYLYRGMDLPHDRINAIEKKCYAV